MTRHPRLQPHQPRPHQLRQVPASFVLPPPRLPAHPAPRRPGAPLPHERRAAPATAPLRPRRRGLRPPRFLAEGAFWSGALTALSVAGLLTVIVATI